LNVALWVVQLLTALAFGQHGYSLLFGLERARKRLAWTRNVETGILRFIGVAEILGAVGVLLPAATGILPWLSVLAAGGLVIIMVLAIVFHLFRREWPNILLNFVLGLFPAAVVYGRLVIAPF